MGKEGGEEENRGREGSTGELEKGESAFENGDAGDNLMSVEGVDDVCGREAYMLGKQDKMIMPEMSLVFV